LLTIFVSLYNNLNICKNQSNECSTHGYNLNESKNVINKSQSNKNIKLYINHRFDNQYYSILIGETKNVD